MNNYKSVYKDGKMQREHRVLWELFVCEIPDGFVLHHIDGDKGNNSIHNMAMMTISAHSKLHAKQDGVWNKGKKYGKMDGYKKSNINRKKNHDKKCLLTLKQYEREKCTQQQLADKLGLSRRQICDRFKRAREIRAMGN